MKSTVITFSLEQRLQYNTRNKVANKPQTKAYQPLLLSYIKKFQLRFNVHENSNNWRVNDLMNGSSYLLEEFLEFISSAKGAEHDSKHPNSMLSSSASEQLKFNICLLGWPVHKHQLTKTINCSTAELSSTNFLIWCACWKQQKFISTTLWNKLLLTKSLSLNTARKRKGCNSNISIP